MKMHRNKWENPNQNRRAHQTIWKFFSEFCQNSSIHGIRYITERRLHWIERVWWIVAFGCSFYLCGSSIIGLWIKWHKNLVTLRIIENDVSISAIPFPTVTICPETKTLKEKFDLSSIYIENRIQLSEFIGIEKTRLETLAHLCDNLVDIYQFENNFVDKSIYDVIADIAPTFDEMFTSCIWQRKYANLTKLFVPIFTEKGLCFSFNSLNSHEIYTTEVAPELLDAADNRSLSGWSLERGYKDDKSLKVYPRRIFNSGERASLVVHLKMSIDDLEYICQGTGLGFKVILSVPGESLKVLRHSFRVPLLEDTQIAIKPEITTSSRKLHKYTSRQRQCFYGSERKLRFFRNYTKLNCEAECLANFTTMECGCARFSMPRGKDTKICGAAKISCYEEAEIMLFDEKVARTKYDKSISSFRHACNCMPACTSIDYDAEINNVKFDKEVLEKSTGLENITARITKLTIFFKDRQVKGLVRVEVSNFTEFFASCGGLLGLCLGVSVLSIIEFIYYFTLRLCCMIRRANSENVVVPFERRVISTIPVKRYVYRH